MHWEPGMRAKVVRAMDGGWGASNIGDIFTVARVYKAVGGHLVIESKDGSHSRYAERCKPVCRVPAVTRPTPETYTELRQAHGPSKYQTGNQVFKAWDLGKYEDFSR